MAQFDFAGQHIVVCFALVAGSPFLCHAINILGLELPVGPIAVSVEFLAEDHLVDVGRRNAKDLGGLGSVVVLWP